MKIKDYSGFKHLIGKLIGISEVIDHDKTSSALDILAKDLDKIFSKISGEIILDKSKEAIIKQDLVMPKKEKVKVGSVRRPTADKLNKSKSVKEEEEEMNKSLTKVIGTEVLEE